HLLIGNLRGRAAHGVHGTSCLWKRDDVANRLLTGQNHDQAIQAERDASMRRRSVLQRLEKEPELFASLGIAEAEDIEDPRLNIAAMDSDGTAANLRAVQHKIVRFGTNVGGVRLQDAKVFVHGRSKWMMAGYPSVFFRRELEQRKVHHPKHVPKACRNPVFTAREF